MARTAISPAVRVVLVVVFLALILAPLGGELGLYLVAGPGSSWPLSLEIFPRFEQALRLGQRPPDSAFARVLAVNRDLLRAMTGYEDRLRDDSWLPNVLRPPVLGVMYRVFRHGGEKVYVGHDGWLYFRADVDSICGKGFLAEQQLRRRVASGSETLAAPRPDPRPAVLSFHRQLASRGIRLVVMPTPVKPVIHARELCGARQSLPPVHNVSYEALLADLAGAGVHVFDPGPLLEARARKGTPQYLRTDTHWRPEAVNAVAQALADRVRDWLPGMPGDDCRHEIIERRVTHRGDSAGLLGLAAADIEQQIPPETVMVREIHDEYGGLWQPQPNAPVLLLGDSFTNIYSLDRLGWGRGGGLAELLSFHLRCPVDRIARNDAGAAATRRLLARELAAGRDRLAGTRVVIWQFATRELAFGNWAPVDLTMGQPPAEHFLLPDPGTTVELTGTVAAASPVPSPGSVPYRDHLRAVHVIDVSMDGKAVEGGQLVTYLESMRDNVWTPAATLRIGDRVRLRVRPWHDVTADLERMNRTELEDVDLQLRPHAWAELISEEHAAVSPRLAGGRHLGGAAVALLLICLGMRIYHHVPPHAPR